MHITAGPGVAVREFLMITGEADYLLYAGGKAIGVVEAKPQGHTLAGVESQLVGYAGARRRGAADRPEGRDVAGRWQLRPDADGPDRVLGGEVHEGFAGHPDQRRGSAPDVPWDRIGVAGTDAGHLSSVAGGRDGQAGVGIPIIEHEHGDLNESIAD